MNDDQRSRLSNSRDAVQSALEDVNSVLLDPSVDELTHEVRADLQRAAWDLEKALAAIALAMISDA